MDGNKRYSLIIGGLIVVGVLIYFLWLMFFNKGLVVFVGIPPFRVDIGIDSRVCLETECAFELPPARYDYLVTKENYYSKSGLVIVQKGDELRIDFELVFIPTFVDGVPFQTYLFPAGYAKFLEKLSGISLFNMMQGKPTLKKLPKKINNIVFSWAGKKALVFEDNKTSLYDLDSFELTEIPALKEAWNAAFNDDDTVIYTVMLDEESGKIALIKYMPNEEGEPRNLVYFTRNVEDYELGVSPRESFVALTDNTFTPGTLYLIDTVNAKRTNIFEGENIITGTWSADERLLVFDGEFTVWGYDTQAEILFPLHFIPKHNLIDFIEGKAAFFVTSSEYSVNSSEWPYTIVFKEDGNAGTVAQEVDIDALLGISSADTLPAAEEFTKTVLVKWDLQTDEFYLLKDLGEMITASPERLEIGKDGVTIRLLADEKVYDIRLEEI